MSLLYLKGLLDFNNKINSAKCALKNVFFAIRGLNFRWKAFISDTSNLLINYLSKFNNTLVLLKNTIESLVGGGREGEGRTIPGGSYSFCIIILENGGKIHFFGAFQDLPKNGICERGCQK